MIALERLTGALRWSGGTGPSSYSTPSIGELAGVPQIVAFSNTSICGLRPSDGRVLWNFAWTEEPFDNAVSPVLLKDNRVFVSANGYGSLLLQVESVDGALTAQRVWENASIDNDYATSVHLGNAIFGSGSSFLFSLSSKNGTPYWQQRGFQLASVLALEPDLLLALDYACEVTVIRASDSRYEELARFSTFAYERCLTAPTVVGGTLFLRNEKHLAAFPLAPREENQ